MEKKIIKKKGGGSEPKRALPKIASRGSMIALTVLAALIISGLAYFFLVKAQLDRVGIGAEIDPETTEANLTRQQAYLQGLKSLEQNYNTIDPVDIDLLSQVLPAGRSTPELLAQLEVIARQSGVDLQRVNITEIEQTGPSARQRLRQEVDGTPAQAAGSSDVKEVIVQIEVAAFDYLPFKEFVMALGQHVRIFDTNSFVFQTEQELQNLTFRTYYLDV